MPIMQAHLSALVPEEPLNKSEVPKESIPGIVSMSTIIKTCLTITAWLLTIVFAPQSPVTRAETALGDKAAALEIKHQTHVFNVSLSSPSNWQQLSYSRIPSNEIDFSSAGLRIDIANSASPLIYPLTPRYFTAAEFVLDISGELNLGQDIQGSPSNDDFLFRLGVVYEGDKQLNFFQKRVAPKWIKTLHKLAPKETGIDTIEFFNVVSDSRLTGQSRTHPLSDLLIEHFVREGNSNVGIQQRVALDPTKRVLALWLSADGDDTQSKYSVLVKKINLYPQ